MSDHSRQPGPTGQRRKRFEEETASHERWLISYADFITLLFAFFVVMYAISSVNEGKYRVLAASLGVAFGAPPARRADSVAAEPAPLAAPVQAPRRLSQAERRRAEALRREKESLTRVASDIMSVLTPLVNSGKVRVTQTNSGVSVEINDSVLFAPGEARLEAESDVSLRAIAQVLRADTHAIRVEGHTDTLPIKSAAFPSNWELSSVRASSVVRLFAENGVAENRLTAVGNGPNHPVGSNQSADGRLRNRRVEILLLATLPETITEVPVRSLPH